MKVFAFYLPQFHEIPENNLWWGNGFTEWTNVQGAKPLFDGHNQPKVPLDKNYYCLLDKQTVNWQTALMHQYGIDGLIYYHYYFKGDMLLQKPAENLLHNPDINQKFFFCWANHSWKRTWLGNQEVLKEQLYGDEYDWQKHFDYLLPFFKDPRYEKKDGKPLFMTFMYFPEKQKYVRFLNEKCKEAGFKGIYMIETFHGPGFAKYLMLKRRMTNETQKLFLRQPTVCMNDMERTNKRKIKFGQKKESYIEYNNGIKIINGTSLYKRMLAQKYPASEIINGLFFEWDNTPRHSERGYIITPPDRAVFEQYMDSISNQEYVFVNAWNEWAEGMVLEPTERDGYKYLEWIRDWRLSRNI
ncbi:MAG: glycoside hydrolase family 99-like domain-containing protein [Blautia sp.]